MSEKTRQLLLLAKIIAHCAARGIDPNGLSHITKIEPREAKKLLSGDLYQVAYHELKEIAEVLGIQDTDLL